MQRPYHRPTNPVGFIGAALFGLLVLSGCPLLQEPHAGSKLSAEMQRDMANLAAAQEAYLAGNYVKARALFDATQHAQDADLARHARYGLACTQLAAAQTPEEFEDGLKLWASWIEFLQPSLAGEDPRLLGVLLPRMAPAEPPPAQSPPAKIQNTGGTQAQKLIQAQRRQTEVLEAKIAVLEKEIRVLNYFEEYSRNLEAEIQTLRNKIQTMQAIDQNIQQKKQEISNQ